MEDARRIADEVQQGAGTDTGVRSLDVVTPFAGTVVPLDSVPDPLFAAGTVGPGVAVIPDAGVEYVTVCAPVPGTLTRLMPHLFLILTDDGIPVLVHLGIDTAHLDGQGYSIHAEQGKRVEAGQRITTYAPLALGRLGFDPIVPVVVMGGGDSTSVRPALIVGEPCEVGDILFRVDAA
ncbi:MAG TPA: PTS glucose transporter subunit IIA [Candidatus Corynebacterium avicola]|uniref:PTS glucose transporter subunit IIA n=1 Tax=Candidatus Corynebacterium avicola TaxID=2838527 RepID=A0A9D1RNE0_9CORY|nr:PTS glucose transporter subunit IIA [Candidatus Corynebacterium avicola]